MRVARLLEGILTSLPNLINISITASYIILAIILIRLLFKKAPKKLVCAMWGIAALRLVLPFSIESAFSLIPAAQTIQTESLRYQGLALQSPAIIDVVTNPVYPQNLSVELPATVDAIQDKITILAFIWIVGVVLMLLYALISADALKRKVSTATLLGAGIKQTDAIDSPFLFGIFKPVIYIPYSVSADDLKYVIAHEQAHIKRKDYLWKPLGFIILSVYWFNPIIWIGYILLCKDIEAACDEKVVTDMQDEDRRLYSTALLNCSIKRPIITACPLAFGEVSVKDRIKNVMNYKKPAFWITIVAIVLCIVLAVCFLTNPYSGKSLDGKLGISMDMAVAEYNHSAHSDGNFIAADYDVMRITKEKDKTTVYAWVYYAEYSFDGTDVKMESASHIPTAITFDTTDDNSDSSSYDVIEYWTPGDGSYYARDIREKFPLIIQSKAFNASGAERQKAKCLQLAKEYYHISDETEASEALLLSEEAIGAAIDQATMEQYAKNVPDGNICVTSHKILDIAVDEQKNTITVYAWVLYERYVPYSASGSFGTSVPVALTFTIDPDKHEIEKLNEYWIPRDGSDYSDDIKKKFSKAAQNNLKNESEFIEELKAENVNKANDAAKKLNLTQESFDALIDEICSSPKESSSYSDYINAHPNEYESLLQYGELGLQYIIKEFIEGGQTGLRGQILWHVLCGFEPEKDFELRADNGQKCFELWQEEAQRLYTKNGAEWMEKYQPSMYLLIKMLEDASVNSSVLSDKPYAAGGWVWPCDNNRISVPFGKRVNPITNEAEECSHINIVGEKGEPVYAACSGEVVKAEYSSGYGNYIEIKHTDGISSQYWHLSEINVTVGTQVVAGDTIGTIGATGMATGPNLGFVVTSDGEYVDPLMFYLAYDGAIVQ